MGMLLRITLDEKPYEIDPDGVTLDEAVVLKREYHLENFLEFSPFDPEQLMGLLAISVARADGLSTEEAKAKVGAVQIGPIMEDISDQIQAIIREAKEAATPPVAASVKRAAAKAGSPARTPVKRGPRKSTVSTATSPGS